MQKETRNLIIVTVVALLIGYLAGGVSQTGHCPISGKIVCKERAAAYDKMKACCAATCEKTSEAAPAAPASK